MKTSTKAFILSVSALALVFTIKCLADTLVNNLHNGIVATAHPPLTATIGDVLVGDGSGFAEVPMSQDATIAATGIITVIKTNNVAFATSATTDTTNAANISSGSLAVARMNNGGVETGDSTATWPAITVTKLGGVAIAASATTDTTSATNITSGTLPVARFPSFTNHALLFGTGATGSPTLLTMGGGNVLQGNAGADPSATVTPTLGIAGTSTGSLSFTGSVSGTVTVKPNNTAGTWTMTLPAVAGTNTYVLQTDGTGITSWVPPALGTVTSVTGTAPIVSSGGTTPAISISAATATTAGAVPTPPNNTTTFLRGDATWATPAGGSGFPVLSSGAGTPTILTSASTTVTGTGSTLIGTSVASTSTGGTNNVIIGDSSDVGAGSNSNSVIIGIGAVGGNQHVVIGEGAGKAGVTALRLTSVGALSAAAITNGSDNCFFGDRAGNACASGANNAFFGSSAGLLVTGGPNTCLGSKAGATTLTTGTFNVLVGRLADTNATGTSGAIVIGSSGTCQGSATSVIIKTSAINSATTNDLVIESGDVGLRRVAAKVLMPTDGAGTGAWIQNTAGRARVNADVPNATATLAAMTGISLPLIAGRKYAGKLIVKCNNSVAAEGIQFNFGGGTATMTSFWASSSETAGGTTVLGTAISTSLAGVINYTTITGETVIEINFSGVVNAGGTFIAKFAENSHATGTATAELGSFILCEDMP